ncbi:MAG: SMP-30/gluconolactonase/LRE family protein [Chitinophagaceae bacterium]|nr:MAG: SMP-30/gluconolactonase/LRE family protein [Chitinophagaceae bacterium]
MEKTINDVTIFCDGLDHPECVAVHSDGSVWAGGEGGQVYHISPGGKEVTEVVNTGGFVLGIAFSPGEEWLAICDLKKACIWRYDLLKNTLSVFATEVEGAPIRIPNFPAFDKKGNLFVSDSGAFRQVNGVVYKFSPDGKGVIWHHGPFNFANGLALSADQKTLYVACTFLPGIEQVTINEDGSAGERSVLLHLPQTCPDGLALDREGNLYIACYAPNAIYRLSPDGELITVIHDWEAHTICNPTNIAFGGKHHQQLYIANLGRWHIARIDMDSPGLL